MVKAYEAVEVKPIGDSGSFKVKIAGFLKDVGQACHLPLKQGCKDITSGGSSLLDPLGPAVLKQKQ